MYLAIARTPAVVSAPPTPAGGTVPGPSSGLGFVPRVSRTSAGKSVLHIPIPQFIYQFPRGMGQAAQANPCACYWPLPGVAPTPGLPACNSSGCAPSCSAQQCATPFCSGIPYGQPGYTECLAATAQAYSVEEPQAAASINTFISTLPASIAKPASTPAAAPPATSSATPPAAPPATPPATPPAAPPAGSSGAPANPSASACASMGGTTNASGQCVMPAGYVSSSASGGASMFSWLEDTVSLFGFSVPVWGLGLAAIAGVWAISSMGKGR
jgi:hypothetical protein